MGYQHGWQIPERDVRRLLGDRRLVEGGNRAEALVRVVEATESGAVRFVLDGLGVHSLEELAFLVRVAHTCQMLWWADPDYHAASQGAVLRALRGPLAASDAVSLSQPPWTPPAPLEALAAVHEVLVKAQRLDMAKPPVSRAELKEAARTVELFLPSTQEVNDGSTG